MLIVWIGEGVKIMRRAKVSLVLHGLAARQQGFIVESQPLAGW